MEKYKLNEMLRHSNFYKTTAKALIGIYTLFSLGLGNVYAEQKDNEKNRNRLDKITASLNKEYDSNPVSALAFIGGLGLLLYSAIDKKMEDGLRESLVNIGGSIMLISIISISLHFESNLKRASLEDEKKTLEKRLEKVPEKKD